MKKKGRGQRICTPVSQWFHTFLASGKCPSSHGGHRFPQNRSTLSRLVAMLDAFLFWKTEYEFRNGLMTSFQPFPEGCRWIKAEIREAIFEDLYVRFILEPNMSNYFSFSWHQCLVTTTDGKISAQPHPSLCMQSLLIMHSTLCL